MQICRLLKFRIDIDGLISSGSEFIFVKLTQDETGPKYSTSDQFGMRRSGDLYEVFRILKQLARGDD